MSAQGLFSIGGIASGLDTNNIIEQLLALERQPVRRLEQQQADLRRGKDAWTQLSTKLSSVRAAVDKLNRVDRFDAFRTTTSSNPDAVSVTTNARIAEGQLSFTVQQLATRQQRASTDLFASRQDTIGGRQLSITINGETHDLTAELGPDATLDDLVKAVNDAKIGVRATALQVQPGQFQLVLDATETGTANSFSVTSSGWNAGFAQTLEAKDALLRVGGVDVVRSSNVIDDLVDGATITLKKVTDAPVTVTSARDIDGAVNAVKGFVDAVNAALTTIADLTRFDPETRAAGPLQGDAAVRRIADQLRNAVTRPLAGLTGSAALASDLGISSTRDGTLQLDEARLRQAFTNDFAGTAARLGRSGTSSEPAAQFLSATNNTQPGTFQVAITQAAEQARTIGSYVPPAAGEQTSFRIQGPGNRTVDVTLTDADTDVQAAATRINATLDAAGQAAVRASVVDGQLALTTTAFGSSARFTVSALDGDGQVVAGGSAFGLEGVHQGVNVAGTINGQAATGDGRTLTGTSGNAQGLSIRVDGMPAEPFTVTWTRGVVGELGNVLRTTEGLGGSIARARASIDSQIQIYQDRIDSFLRRVESREATIRRQFVGLETAIGRLNEQGQWLGQQLAGLNAQQR